MDDFLIGPQSDEFIPSEYEDYIVINPYEGALTWSTND